MKIDALRVAIKEHDLKVEAVKAEAATALQAAQIAPLSYASLRRRSSMFTSFNFKRANSDMSTGNGSARRRSFLGR